MRRSQFLILVLLLIASAIFLLNCGGGGGSEQMGMGTVSVTLSDPPTCSAPQGPYSHIYVTIVDVTIHQSANASDNDSGWVDLTPNLHNNPTQVDLLGVANQCFLAMLGSTGIQPGTYQQIRILLADDNVTVQGNKCGSTNNCLMLTSDPSNTPQPLLLSSESKTGIKIPPGQIAGGHFVVAPGDTKDLNIDFNACASIVVEGNGKYRLKPVLHAGEISTNSPATAISGTIIDGATQQPPLGGNTVVVLEQKNASGVDRVIMETVTGSNGGFAFCPVPDGTYDIIAVATNAAGETYAATVITGVQPGNLLGNVPLTPAALPGSITGQITTSTGNAATAADLTVSALQSIGPYLVTVPLAQQSSATLTLTTAPGAGCPANTDCASYTLSVPAANPSIGAFNPAGNQTPAPPAPGPVNYTSDANAFIPDSGGLADCSPSNMQTSMTDTNNPLTETAGNSVTAATLTFTGCQ